MKHSTHDEFSTVAHQPYRPFAWVVLALVICCALPVSSQARGRKFAVVVGINEYANPKINLEGSVNDATRMRELLKREFSVAPANVILLLNQQATRLGIINAINHSRQKISSGDLFVFYYSGHGTLFPDDKSEERDETNVLPETTFPNGVVLPAGRYDSAIVPHDAFAESGKPWRSLILDDELFALFSGFTNAGCSVVLISDSCNSGSLGRDFNEKARTVSPMEALAKPLEKIAPPKNSREVTSRDLQGKYLVITSSRDTQLTLEKDVDAGKKAGLFTYSFRKAVENAAHNRQQGKLTYRMAFGFVRETVLQMSGQRQEPQLDTRFYNGSLDVPLFSLPDEFSPAGNDLLRVVVRVTDINGNPLEGCAFIVFKPGVSPPPRGQITKEQALILGRTDGKGLYSSQDDKTLIAPGTYQVKVVRKGYQSFEGAVPVKAGLEQATAVLAVRLVKE